ncbi:MAG: hypothetical protein ABW172_17395, partial [Candidatus Binatia bacterium]
STHAIRCLLLESGLLDFEATVVDFLDVPSRDGFLGWETEGRVGIPVIIVSFGALTQSRKKQPG